MGKALIIPNTDFSANSVAQIVIDTNPIPCEGIDINKSALSLQNVGTSETLTVTVTPSDTTDRVIWSSSDETVAMVNNGNVTVVGVGTTTITATCGSFSATCVVTTRCFMIPNLATVNGVYLGGVGFADGGNGLPSFQPSSSRGTWLGASGVYSLYGTTASDYFPYVLPKNAEKIRITCDKTSYQIYKIALMNANTATTPYGTASLIRNLGSSGVTTETDGYSLIIPTIEGYSIDSVGISMRNMSGDWIDSDCENVVIEFLPAS